MILVSIRPFAVRKTLLFVVAIICLSSAACFADSLFLSVYSTPYDRQMSRIQPALVSTRNINEGHLSLPLVNQWIGDLRAIPYCFSQDWKTPAEVTTGASADCKAKAVALYRKMKMQGASNLRLVIGQRSATSRVTHTWLLWGTKNGTYVLDPTINWSARRAEEIGDKSYIPYYAYAGNRRYRAASSLLYAKN